MIEVRIHGRGGQGAVTSAEMVALAAISEGKYAQAFPSFGPERRGAPVQAFIRVSSGPIKLRCDIRQPDVVVVLDPALITVAQATHLMRTIETLVDKTPSSDPEPNGWEGIAIIGMALRFPDANSPDQLWYNLCQGKESVTFFTFDQLDSAVAETAKENANYVKARGLVAGADQFDASFFKISPREAQIIDPQHRLFLELAWAALEDACYTNDQKGVTGVFGGSGFNSYYKYHVAPAHDLIEMFGDHATDLANAPDSFTTRVSYKLNLNGPSMSIFTGCSTSLVAVCQACDSLISYGLST